MRLKVVAAVAACLLGIMGCDNTVEEVDAGGSDAGASDSGGPAACGIPTDGFGVSEGSNFLPLTLSDCDGADYEFYGDAEGYGTTTFTVVSIAAGWCAPCRREAALMQEFLVDRYGPNNVRVIVAIIQNNDYEAPDAAFCSDWRSRYGLTNPVLLDPTQETQLYFPAGSLPATLIVDCAGQIVHREYGVSDSLETVRAELDSLLGL